MKPEASTTRAARKSIANAKNPKFNRDDMKYFYDQGYTFSQIARIMGCSPTTVRYYLEGLGLKNNPRRWESEKNWDDLAFLALYEQGKNDPQIAAALDVSRTMVRDRRHKLELPANAKPGRQPLDTPDKDDDQPEVCEQLEIKKEEEPPTTMKPVSKEDWKKKRLNHLLAWLQHQLSIGEAPDTELLAEYLELVEQ